MLSSTNTCEVLAPRSLSALAAISSEEAWNMKLLGAWGLLSIPSYSLRALSPSILKPCGSKAEPPFTAQQGFFVISGMWVFGGASRRELKIFGNVGVRI